ncbi:hypothetical protein NGRA_2226 [Nosema granulosis]|uniref:Uncharacterized protein n=1 Tax=Nosema granulosis TaxID=83296 RepID=A0A9P6GY19_9MICR|nr:hypothetical protein NGRA_2226 [Nosema granulosis]
MLIFSILSCVETNTLFFKKIDDKTQDLEILLDTQMKIDQIFLMKKINSSPFFVKNVQISRQRYCHTEKDGKKREVSKSQADNFSNLSTLINLSFDISEVAPGEDFFLFVLVEEEDSFNIGFFEVDPSRIFTISKDHKKIYYITKDQNIPLEIVDSPVKFKANEEDEEKKKWSTKEGVLFIFGTCFFTILVLLGCVWYSQKHGGNKKIEPEATTI